MRKTVLRIPLTFIIIVYIAVVVTSIRSTLAKGEESTQTTYSYEKKVTEDLVSNTIKSEYPADKWKVVPIEEVCIPPSPCAKKKPETVETVHDKLKYECPPCRKCVKEINQINRLKTDVSEYIAEIKRLKKQLDETQEKLDNELDKEPEISVVEKRIPDEKKNYLYVEPIYAQDGILATETDGQSVYEATPVESLQIGGGYTRFFSVSENFDIGAGIGGFIGQTGFGVKGQLGVKF